MIRPDVSVIVPTHDRRDSVLRLLEALGQNRAVPFEVIVVADGCADDTADAIRHRYWPVEVQVMVQAASGPAAARNLGAAAASGELLVFLDDDVEPRPGLLAAHVKLHAEAAHAVGIGALPPAVEGSDFYHVALRSWWELMHEGAREPGHRYEYRDVLSGHFSIRRADFWAIGGFETGLRCHEDYELGYRAIEARLTLQFLPDAAARHHDRSDVHGTLRRKYDEGVADVQIAQRHPDLLPRLPLMRPATDGRRRRLLLRLAWSNPRLADAIARAAARFLPLYEHWKLRYRWRGRLETLMVYWYWRGVAQALGSRDRLEALRARVLQAKEVEPALTIDLSDGLERARQTLDAVRPAAVRLVWGGRVVGVVPAEPGAERLRGVHLAAILVDRFPSQFLRAAAAAQALPPALAACGDPHDPVSNDSPKTDVCAA